LINQQRLVQTFLDLVAIDSPSGEEEQICKELIRRFEALGGVCETDAIHNLFARFDGTRGGEWIMLSAHMDTVGQDRGI
jgi:tripeptide aminopeptidase